LSIDGGDGTSEIKSLGMVVFSIPFFALLPWDKKILQYMNNQ
jgi:hypothetical protein